MTGAEREPDALVEAMMGVVVAQGAGHECRDLARALLAGPVGAALAEARRDLDAETARAEAAEAERDELRATVARVADVARMLVAENDLTNMRKQGLEVEGYIVATAIEVIREKAADDLRAALTPSTEATS